MKFTINQQPLNKALQICSRALSESNIVPLSAYFLFDISGKTLTISGCNTSLSITTKTQIEAKGKLTFCLPGKKIADYISKSQPESLSFEILENSLNIKSKTGKCIIPIESSEDFPVITAEGEAYLKIPSEDFLEVLYKTMFAISDDQLRPSATGLNLIFEPGVIIASSLDFTVVSTLSLKTDQKTTCNCIVPKKSLQIIQSLSPTGDMKMCVGKNAAFFEFNDIVINCMLVDEKFPDFLSITPIENDIEFLTSRSELLRALKRIMPFSDSGKLIKLDIGESLLLTAENIDFSEEANETISGVLTGDQITVGLPGEYLLNILNSFTDEKLWLSFSSPKMAVIITDGEKHINPGKENLVLLMPLWTA